MAEPTLITLDNYTDLLRESQAGRAQTTGSITATVVAATRTISRTAGSFVTDRFQTGQIVQATGFVNGANNATWEIESVASDGLSIVVLDPGPALVDESETAGVEITAAADGNIFFDALNGRLELITLEELAQVDLGMGLEANPLTNRVGIFIGAVYAFERLRRRQNEYLRQFDSYQAGTFKFAGAYELINGRKFSTVASDTGDDRTKLRGSGWLERNPDGSVDKIFFGARSLAPILDNSQPYYQLAAGGAPSDFAKDGPVDEAIEVTAPANFLSIKVRTFGQNFDAKTLVDSGITEMSGYSAGFALGETPHLTTDPDDTPLVDVAGDGPPDYTGQIAPWTGMRLVKLAVPQTEGGFTQADGDFSWVLSNTGNGTLDQCVAFLDALATFDADIDDGLETVTFGKRVGTWYSYDALGRIVTRSGAGDGLGLFIESIPVADQQRVVLTADDGNPRTYPFLVDLRLSVGAFAAADSLAWYHVWETADYGTAEAVTLLEEPGGAEVKGDVNGQPLISHPFNFDAFFPTDPGAELDIVAQCEGDGDATQAKAAATITRTAIITVTVAPGLETNV